jgi:hypothetical protein
MSPLLSVINIVIICKIVISEVILSIVVVSSKVHTADDTHFG